MRPTGDSSIIDLASIAFHVAGMLDTGQEPAGAVVQGPVELVELEIDGINEADHPVNGVLSVLIFDESFADGGNGLFAREVLGVVAADAGARLRFVHEIEVTGMGTGEWYIVPSVTSVDDDVDMKRFAFEPSAVCIEVR